jgi:hypothetical protein
MHSTQWRELSVKRCQLSPQGGSDALMRVQIASWATFTITSIEHRPVQADLARSLAASQLPSVT